MVFVFFFCIVLMLPEMNGQHDGERRAFALPAAGRYKPAMGIHYLLDDGQAYARSFEFRSAVQPLEDDEDLIQVALVEANAIVRYRDTAIGAVFLLAAGSAHCIHPFGDYIDLGEIPFRENFRALLNIFWNTCRICEGMA